MKWLRCSWATGWLELIFVHEDVTTHELLKACANVLELYHAELDAKGIATALDGLKNHCSSEASCTVLAALARHIEASRASLAVFARSIDTPQA